ncbi:MAG: cation:dicarboxylase symporter family transporter [Selenomonadaceae bacterium]|nr:cation:dicarboxylase symporter family transporter [Selenomonadaceae bacterium]
MDLSNICGPKRKADDMTEKVFIMPRDSVAGIMEHLQQTVGQKLTDEELLRGRMVLEETFARLQAGMNNPDMTATVRIKKRFGDIHLVLSARGEAVNPIMSLTEWVEDDIDLYSVNVLKANRDRMGYSRKNGANVISIKVHEASIGTIYKISASIFLGLLLGLIMRGYAPQAAILAFDHYFQTPITALFMNALGMMVAPVIFFSIIAGITNLSETIDIGKIGKRLVGQSFFIVFLAAILSVGLALAIFPDDLAFMASLFGNKLEGGVMMAKVMNIPVTMDFVLFLTFYVFVISYTNPAVPGGGLIAMATVFAVFGIPTQAVVVFMCVEVLADMFDTLNNVSVNIASSLLLAKKCDMWDEKIYLD